MTAHAKVLWAEGVLLGQQHFQQWDNYYHHCQYLLMQTLVPFYYGIRTLQIDEDALKSGKLIIQRCQAFFPHGAVIDFDHRFDGPLTRQLTNLQDKTLEIWLAIPISKNASGITGYPSEMRAAWKAYYQSLTDDFDPQREREVLLGKPNLHVLYGEEDRSSFHALKILEVVQQGISQFRGVDTFIPACHALNASTRLIDLLRTHIELLSAKIRLLRDRRQPGHTDNVALHAGDLTDFLLLQLFNGFLPFLQSLAVTPQWTPWCWYQRLIEFIGNLSTFSAEQTHFSLPDYCHEDLRCTFQTLDSQLQLLLESVIPERMAVLRLRRESDTLYVVDNIDSTILEKYRFYLAVAYDAPQSEWLMQFARQVKVGARSMIENIIASALPGVNLTHTQRPPNKLPIKAGYEYFYLEPLGPFWQQIKQERTLALLIAHDFNQAHIELMTVME